MLTDSVGIYDMIYISMKLNGTEYYYIRNAQGDIIGLFDKTGVQVVSYTYDTWGKLISIKCKDGKDVTTDTTNVGYKNPYRYRGYRYDNETGLYYLNSRYYSAEWGRFINADGIVGQAGELLGHNLFAYCKNNPVNKYDSNGFMALDCEGHGRTYTQYPTVNPIVSHSVNVPNSCIFPSYSQSKNVVRSATVAGIEGGASSILKDVPDFLTLGGNRAARRAGQNLIIPVKGASAARGIGYVEKVGAVGVVLTGATVWDNYHSGYCKSEAFGRSAIDVGIATGVIIFGVSNPVGWTMAAGFGVGIVGEGVKNYIWKKH